MTTKTSFIILNEDSIENLIKLSSDITESNTLKQNCEKFVKKEQWENFVEEMLRHRVPENILNHTSSGSKAFFSIVTHLILELDDASKQESLIRRLVDMCEQDSSQPALRLDIIINIVNLVSIKNQTKLHATLFSKIVSFALKTGQHKRIAIPSNELFNILSEYGGNLSKEQDTQILLQYATLYEKLHRRADAHKVYQQYLSYDNASSENVLRVVANVLNTVKQHEIKDLLSYKAVSDNQQVKSLLETILSRDIESYTNYASSNKDFIKSLSSLISEEAIMDTVRVLSLTRIFEEESKAEFTYDELKPALKADTDKQVEKWVIFGVSKKLFKVRLNPRQKMATLLTVNRTHMNKEVVHNLQSKLQMIERNVDHVLNKETDNVSKKFISSVDHRRA